MQNYGQIPSICSQDIEQKQNSVIKNEILIEIRGHNSLTNLRKLTLNNHNLDLVNINAYAKFGQIPSIRSQDIERKRSRNYGMIESRTTVYPHFVCRGKVWRGYNYHLIITKYPHLFHCITKFYMAVSENMEL